MSKESEAIEKYILKGSYINCNGKNYTCLNHDLIEGEEPREAAKKLVEKGWTLVGETVLCPDCSIRNKGLF